MRLSYEEIERYYNNGVLEELCMKTNMLYSHLVGTLLDKVVECELEVDTSEESRLKCFDKLDELEQKVNYLEDENISLKEKLFKAQVEQEELLTKLNKVLPEPHYTDKLGNFY